MQQPEPPLQDPPAFEHTVQIWFEHMPLQQSEKDWQAWLPWVHCPAMQRPAPLHEWLPVHVDRSQTHAPEAHFSPKLQAGVHPPPVVPDVPVVAEVPVVPALLVDEVPLVPLLVDEVPVVPVEEVAPFVPDVADVPVVAEVPVVPVLRVDEVPLVPLLVDEVPVVPVEEVAPFVPLDPEALPDPDSPLPFPPPPPGMPQAP